MNTSPYNQFVASIAKPGLEILTQLTPSQAHLLHMAVGVSGEAGELLDAIKKHTIYQKQLDIENVKEEIGDIVFYATGLLNELGLSLQECIQENQEKLSVRYPSGKYTNAHAIARADKVESVAIEEDLDADLADVKIEKVACNLGEECESCQ